MDETSAGLGCMVCLLDAGLNAETDEIDESWALVPDEVGVYTIEHRSDGSAWELGRGAMGVTYLAVDKLLDRRVALKIINSNLGSRSAEARERFMREARAAAALRHPNVATVYQFGVREETGQFFYAMELVEGETLEERVRRLGPLDVLTTIDIAMQVTAALEAAEERGLVHRDLKPGNLMLVAPSEGKTSASTSRPTRDYSNGRVVATALRRRAGRNATDADGTNEKLAVKVIDFGVAKAVVEKTNAMALTHGGFVGTPAFASPEQFTNAPVDVRSDIYSLGATLWFLLTGHMLFSGRSIEEIRDARRSNALPTEQLKTARVPRRFISLLTSMLAIEPAARPAGARDLAAKLQSIRTSNTGRGKTAGRLALAAAIVALATIVAVREFHSVATNVTPSPIPEKGIAVLPLENLSRDPDNAYFAEGIQEEILTRLARVAGLKVISHTSTQRYQSKPVNLGEIAKQLGVANILEGSVQKTADQVRVNVQLINAQTDSHLWADTYDRKLTDILGVESEIAKRVAQSLQAKLTGREEQALAVKPTNNPEAYDAYLRGLAFDSRAFYSGAGNSMNPEIAWKGIDSYQRAVELDPKFAIAWARLSREEAQLYSNGNDTAPAARRDAAKRALENAQELAPNSPESLLALGYYQFWVLRDYGAAKTTFEGISKILPGSSEALEALGKVARRGGHWDESIAYFNQARALDPRNGQLLILAARTYAMVRQFSAALKLYDIALDITSDDPELMAAKASIYQAQGSLQEAAILLTSISAQTTSWLPLLIKSNQLRLERNYGEAVRFLQAMHQAPYDGPVDKALGQVWIARAQRLAGDTAGAKATAELVRNTLEPLYRNKTETFPVLDSLSQAYALMGDKDSALEVAERAIVLLPRTKDALTGPTFEENLAVIQTLVGENSRAISTLAQLLETPYDSWLYSPASITPALLRLDPLWDPLRSDPAFQKLCEEKQP